MNVTASKAPQGVTAPDPADEFTKLVAHADDNMVTSQRLAELISNAPELEIDIAIGNTSLDHLGVARALYTLAGKVEGEGRGEDELSMFRTEREYTNLLLVEQPNEDFAHTVMRQFLFDVYQKELWDDLAESDDETLAGIAGRALKENAYHLRYSSGWVVRLGDGTHESHRRCQAALDTLWQYTTEMFENNNYRPSWEETVAAVLAEATLGVPDDPYQRTGGRSGFHTEHLGFLLAEMQWVQRSYPGLDW